MQIFSSPVLHYGMKKLLYFKGKICTVLTRPASIFFDQTQHVNVFVGLVDDVDDFGVWIIQLNTKRKSFFFAHSLVGIIEEVVTPVSDKEAQLIKKEVAKKTEDAQTDLIQVDKLKLMRNAANKGPQQR